MQCLRRKVPSLKFPCRPGLPEAERKVLRLWKHSGSSQRRRPQWEGSALCKPQAKCRRGGWTRCRRGRAGGWGPNPNPASPPCSQPLASQAQPCPPFSHSPSGFEMRTLGLRIAEWQQRHCLEQGSEGGWGRHCLCWPRTGLRTLK